MTRWRWAVVDGWTVTQRDLIHWARQPVQFAVNLLFPVLVVLMFGYLFGGGMPVPGGGNYREYLMPGMFAVTMMFGIEATYAAVTTDAARGVTDRFRSMPMAPSAVVVGRSAADMLNSVLVLGVMVLCGLAVGWGWHRGAGPALAAFGLLLLLRFALLWLGIYLALLVRSTEGLAAVQILVWPLGFLSNAFAVPADMPSWLGTIVEWNPLSATISASRYLFGNPGSDAGSVIPAVGWPLVLTAIFIPLAVRRYRRLSH